MELQNFIQHFELQSSAIRGRFIQFTTVLDDIISAHDYDEDINDVLAQQLIMTALFSSLFKYEGVFSVQTHAEESFIRSVLSDVTSEGVLRGTATKSDDDSKKSLADAEKSYIVFTIDQGLGKDQYQGVVDLRDGSLLSSFQHYFNQSEQIPTGIKIHIDKIGKSWCCRGILLQVIPQSDESESDKAKSNADEDDWRRVMTLLGTCTDEELSDIDLSYQDLLIRLFHEEGVVLYDCQSYKKGCRCSRERLKTILSGMDDDEKSHMVVDDAITVTCEFCNSKYRFHPNDIQDKL